MPAQPTPNPNAIPVGSSLSDRDLVRKVLADSRRRMLVEMVMQEMDLADQRGNNVLRFEVTVNGRRLCLVPQGKQREVILDEGWQLT